TLADEIASLDVMSFQTILLPLTADDPRNKTFRYEGYDIITLRKEVERDYTIPEPQTAQEVIGYYSRRIAEAVKLPSQFAALAPKVREFFEQKAFGQAVDLSDAVVVKAMGTPVAHYVCVDVFSKALKKLTSWSRWFGMLQTGTRPALSTPNQATTVSSSLPIWNMT